jgi:hypothetical protein
MNGMVRTGSIFSKIVTLKAFIKRRIEGRCGGAFIGFALFFLASFVTRGVLFCKSLHVVDFNFSLLGVFLWGVLFDAFTAVLAMAPVAIFLALLPKRFFEMRLARWLAHF